MVMVMVVVVMVMVVVVMTMLESHNRRSLSPNCMRCTRCQNRRRRKHHR